MRHELALDQKEWWTTFSRSWVSALAAVVVGMLGADRSSEDEKQYLVCVSIVFPTPGELGATLSNGSQLSELQSPNTYLYFYLSIWFLTFFFHIFSAFFFVVLQVSVVIYLLLASYRVDALHIGHFSLFLVGFLCMRCMDNMANV